MSSVNQWMKKLTSDFGVIASDFKTSEEVIKLPSPSFNWATGTDGIPMGKFVCFWGPESSGKSLMAMLSVIEIQKKHAEAICIWFDAEYAFSKGLFEKLGGDSSRLIIRSNNDPLSIFDYIGGELKEMIQEGAPIKALVIDSVNSIRYPADEKKQTTDQIMGGTGAKYLGPALKLIMPVIKENNILLMMINQVYMQLDAMKALRNPYILPGGKNFAHSLDQLYLIERLDTKSGIIESGETIAGGVAQIGHRIRIKNRKNRCGIPYRVAEFSLDYEKGLVNIDEEIFNLGKSLNVINHPINPATGKPNPQHWQFKNYDPIRGEDNMKKWVASNKNIQDEVITECSRKHSLTPVEHQDINELLNQE